jgi:hypothetical protein
MRHTTIAAAAVAIALFIGACTSTQEGVKTNMLEQWTTVAANTEKTTEAAKAVLEEHGLKEVTAESTNIDGKATAKKADGTKITVSIAKESGEVSKVTIAVGKMGDSTLGAELAKKIKEKAEKKS